MMMLPLAKISFLWTMVAVLWVLIAVALILIVLIQKGRGGGLAAAFGGGAANSLLGTKTGDFLTWVTIGLVSLFLVVGVLMGKFMRPVPSADLLGQQPAAEQPAAPADAATAAEQPAQKTPEAAAATATEQVEQAAEQATDAAKPADAAVPAETPTVPTQN